MSDTEKQKKAFNLFINRNTQNYIKVSNVSNDIIQKYQGLVPNELIEIWKKMGFGIYEDGFLQIVNPEEYDFVFDYIDKRLEPTIVFGVTALGDLLLWEGNDNWTIAPDEGNRCKIIRVNDLYSKVSIEISYFLGLFISNEDALKDPDMFNSKAYLDVKDKLPKLKYGQCYGYTPALPLGGKAKNENLQVVDAKSYINIIGQAVGKIYSKN